MTNTQILYAILFLQLVIVCLFLVVIYKIFKKKTYTLTTHKEGKEGTCSKDTCGAIDNVNDPAYNMQNIVKQSILVEEHIAEKNKYCLSCICKHFQHIIGLSEESVWMAGKDVSKYPYLDDSVSFYQTLFDTWLENKNNDATKLDVLSKLRDRRRKLIDVYFLK